MSIESQLDREEELIAEEYAEGKITLEEYNRQIAQVERKARDAYYERELYADEDSNHQIR